MVAIAQLYFCTSVDTSPPFYINIIDTAVNKRCIITCVHLSVAGHSLRSGQRHKYWRHSAPSDRPDCCKSFSSHLRNK